MDTSIAMTRLEAAFDHQVLVAGGDDEVGRSVAALVGALEPAVRQVALDLAEQAAAEVAAQLPSHEIDVVLSDGEPTLRVRSVAGDDSSNAESLDARITLRLPPTLKERVEVAAGETGDSVNSWLVKALSTHAHSGSSRGRRRISGVIET